MAQELYQLPKGWEWKKVADVSMDIQYGHTAKATEAGNARFLRITDIQDGQINWDVVPLVSVSKSEFSKYKLNQHDLVFARSGATAGKSILICDPPDNSIFASYLIRIIPRTNLIDPVFISQYFLSPAYWRIVVDNASGAAQPNINGSKLAEFDIPLPPLPEQKRIVAKLDALLSRIAQATQELQESLALADQLFASALDEAFNPLGSAKNAEGLYELPKGWRQVELGSVATLLNGRAYKQEELLDEGPSPVLRVGNFFSNRSWYYSDLELPEDKYCDNGDLLFAWSASFGPKIWDGPRVIFHYHIWKILTSAHIEKMFLFYLLDKDSEDIKSQGNGVGMFHATKGGMEKKIIPLPPLPEQKRIVQRLEALQAKQKQLKETLNEKIAGLNALKASLLDAAFRGEL